MAKSQASNFDLPSYWWPRSRLGSRFPEKNLRSVLAPRDINQIAEQAVLVLLDQAVEQVRVALLQAARDGFRFIAHQRGEEQSWTSYGRSPKEAGPLWRQT